MKIHQQILNLFQNDTDDSFKKLAISVFKTQAEHNKVYRRFLNLINCEVETITHFQDIPLMPISFFKNYLIQTHNWKAVKVFRSSGTGGIRSLHPVKDLSWYDSITKSIFEKDHCSLAKYEVLALLPNYIENGDSSLVHMVDHFQKLSNTTLPASFLYNHTDLADRISASLVSNKKILLVGVTYALLDFAKKFSISNPNLEILFTGGMKNKKKEMTYQAIAETLQKSFSLSKISAEYGMTELLSQAYSDKEGEYYMPATMRIVTKQLHDPVSNCKLHKAGLVGIIDLANIDSCSFILTEDLGVVSSSRTFKILGRQDNSDLRGCNLLYDSEHN